MLCFKFDKIIILTRGELTMRKALLIFVFLVAVAGCADTQNETIGVLENVKIIEKTEVDPCARCGTEYSVTFEKDGEEVVLNTINDNLYRALSEGTTVDVYFDSEYYIDRIKFKNIQKPVDKNNK